jgi:hypothetical protein
VNVCPHCNSSLIGDPIPQEYIDRGYYRPGATHFRREIGVEIPGVYDGVLFWQCPDCAGRWHRWPEGHELRERAQPHVSYTADPDEIEWNAA